MDYILSVVGELNDPRQDSGDSTCDRLNSRHSVCMFFALSIILTLKQHYIGSPIKCWHPDHFEESHEIYTDQLCWINNTYYLSFNESIPDAEATRKFIGYYQWTSIILAAQAVMFYIPRMIWMTMNKKSGIEVTTITGAAIDCIRSQDSVSRERVMAYMTKHMTRYLTEMQGKQRLSSKFKSLCWQFYGSYLSFLYIITKILYVLNAGWQLVMLDLMLGLRHHLHGLDFIRRLFFEDTQMESPLFPRIAYCDFQVRYLGNVLRYTVQCSLPINLFNEKIFIFVWFWLVFIVSASFVSLCIWLWRYIYRPSYYGYVKTRLVSMDKLVLKDASSDALITSFCRDYLHRDGMLIVRLTAINSSDLVASELLAGLWDYYMKQERKEDEDVVLSDVLDVVGNNNAKSNMELGELPHHSLLGAGAAIDERALENADLQKQKQEQRRHSVKRKQKR